MNHLVKPSLLVLAALALSACVWVAIVTSGSAVGSAIAQAISLRVIPPHPFQREMVTIGGFRDPPEVRILDDAPLSADRPTSQDVHWPDEMLVARGAILISHHGLWGTTRRTFSMSIICEQFDRERSVHEAEMERIAVDHLKQQYAARGYSVPVLARTVTDEFTVQYTGSANSIAWGGVLHNVITLIAAAALLYLVVVRNVLFCRIDLPTGKCHECGYDLRGTAHEHCPECGAAITAHSGSASPR